VAPLFLGYKVILKKTAYDKYIWTIYFLKPGILAVLPKYEFESLCQYFKHKNEYSIFTDKIKYKYLFHFLFYL